MKIKKEIIYLLTVTALGIIGYFIVDHFNLKERVSKLEGKLDVLTGIQEDIVKIKGDILKMPSLSISDKVYDKMGTLIDINNAPFEISIKGNCSNVKDKYLYLIVEDENIQYVQSGLGLNYDGAFEGKCFLGESGNDKSLNKNYKVFAVIVNRSYQPFDVIDRETIVIESQKINLKRKK